MRRGLLLPIQSMKKAHICSFTWKIFIEYLLSAKKFAKNWCFTSELSTPIGHPFRSARKREDSKRHEHMECVCVRERERETSTLMAQALTDSSKVTQMPLDLSQVVMIKAGSSVGPSSVPGAELSVPYMCVSLFYPDNNPVVIPPCRGGSRAQRGQVTCPRSLSCKMVEP